jgi:hypothetical protein
MAYQDAEDGWNDVDEEGGNRHRNIRRKKKEQKKKGTVMMEWIVYKEWCCTRDACARNTRKKWQWQWWRGWIIVKWLLEAMK